MTELGNIVQSVERGQRLADRIKGATSETLFQAASIGKPALRL